MCQVPWCGVLLWNSSQLQRTRLSQIALLLGILCACQGSINQACARLMQRAHGGKNLLHAAAYFEARVLETLASVIIDMRASSVAAFFAGCFMRLIISTEMMGATDITVSCRQTKQQQQQQ
jgi:hypothetical protein